MLRRLSSPGASATFHGEPEPRSWRRRDPSKPPPWTGRLGLIATGVGSFLPPSDIAVAVDVDRLFRSVTFLTFAVRIYSVDVIDQILTESETRYPILSLIIKDIFAIPSSTVASESVFSLGKRVVDPFRSSLSPKMVEALVCTSDWLKVDEMNFYKDPTDDDLELYKEIEEIEKAKNAIQDYSRTLASSSS
ncbi:hypothetical protein ACS0TY_024874 [Phlomoides rotata]